MDLISKGTVQFLSGPASVKTKVSKAACKKGLYLVAAVFMGMFAVACQKSGEQAAPGPAPVVEDTVTSEDGVPIHYQVQGEGSPALFFVHGWSCDNSYWDAQKDAFGKKHKVVAIDLGGHGKSGLNRDNWTIEAFGADVRAVAGKLKLDRMVLIGHSMGGPVTLEAAKGLGPGVVAIVGADTFQDLENEPSEEQKQGFIQGFENDFSQAMDRMVRSMFPGTADPALVDRIVADMSLAPPQVARSALKNLFNYDVKATLKQVRAPIYSINCDLFPTNVEGNRRQAASFELSPMPGVGHFVQMEDPEKFNRLLAEVVGKY